MPNGKGILILPHLLWHFMEEEEEEEEDEDDNIVANDRHHKNT